MENLEWRPLHQKPHKTSSRTHRSDRDLANNPDHAPRALLAADLRIDETNWQAQVGRKCGRQFASPVSDRGNHDFGSFVDRRSGVVERIDGGARLKMKIAFP